MADPPSNSLDKLPRSEAPRYQGYLGSSGAYTLAGTHWQLGLGDRGVSACGKARLLRCVPLSTLVQYHLSRTKKYVYNAQ